MARLLPILIFLIFNSLILISSETLTSFKPKQLVLPVRKDQATNLFTTTIKTRIPSVALPFVVHLNGKFLWVNCDAKYWSLTYKAPNCRSTECAKASGTATTCFTCSSIERPGCHKESCALMPMNPVTHETSMGELGQDVLSIQTTKGSSPGQFVSVPQFLFSCASSSLLQNGLPGNVEGVAGLGHFPISIPTQLASRFDFAPKFAICLPSTTSSSGAVFFGDGPYYLRPGNLDVSRGLTYTPVKISPTGKYYIQVTEIRINKKPVPVNPALLTMNKQGRRGTRFSTTKPFGILEHSIFQSVTRAFAREFDAIRVKAVAPFGLCYELQTDRNVASVPEIEFVLQNQNVKWTILGANSMVQVRQGVSCFAFIDGGEKHKAAIIIGAHQLQDNLLQFDLAKSNLGFSPRSTTCDFNFNPKSTP